MTEQKINLNTATPRELYQLSGIGPTLAARIITYRETVHPFEEPIEITAVPGISENTYRAIADRLTVEESEENEVIEEVVGIDTTPPPAQPQDQAPAPIPAERALIKSVPPAEPGPGPEPEAEPELEPEPEPPSLPVPPRSPPARPGYFGLTVAALMSALFGALLALLVIGGINGTLDFGQAEAVVSNQAELERLSIRADTLQADLEGLRQRLDRLEGLTARMDGVEGAVDDLDTALGQVQSQANALNARADQLDADIAAVRAAAERFNLFLDGLRDLLFEFQGAPPTPSPTPTLPPTATPRPTRTPRPSPTPQPTRTAHPTPTPTGAP